MFDLMPFRIVFQIKRSQDRFTEQKTIAKSSSKLNKLLINS